MAIRPPARGLSGDGPRVGPAQIDSPARARTDDYSSIRRQDATRRAPRPHIPARAAPCPLASALQSPFQKTTPDNDEDIAMSALRDIIHKLLAFGAGMCLVFWLGGLAAAILYKVLHVLAYGVLPDMSLVTCLPTPLHGQLLVLEGWPRFREMALWLLDIDVTVFVAVLPFLCLAACLAGLRLTAGARTGTRPPPTRRPFSGGFTMNCSGGDVSRCLAGRFSRRA